MNTNCTNQYNWLYLRFLFPILMALIGSSMAAYGQDGTQKWAFPTGGFVGSPAIGADGTLYVGSNDFNLYAINPDGTQKWAFPTGNNVGSPAIGADGTVYVGSFELLNNLYAINPDGTQKWVFRTGEAVNASPAIGADGTLYVGNFASNLIAINPDGTLKWFFHTGGAFVTSSPAIGADGTVYVGAATGRLPGTGDLFAINPDGTQKWAFPAADVSSSPAIGADGTLYVGSSGDSIIYAINPDGTQKWAFPTGDNVRSSPAIGTDGTVYVGSNDNNLYAINPDGTQKWAFPTGGNVSPPAIGADGTLYVGSGDGNLYAINGSSGGLSPDAPWPKFSHDVKNTGRVPQGPNTVLVANFMNGNTDFFRSRIYLWNPSVSPGSVSVRVFTLEQTGFSTLLGMVNLGSLGSRSALNLRLEDILDDLLIPRPYETDAGNLTLEFTIGAADVIGAAQVFDNSQSLAFGTYPLQRIE